MSLDALPAGGGAADCGVPSEEGKDEAPWVVARDIASRHRPRAHVIAFANEKGGVGKSTLAFHTAMALEHLGHRVLTVDCDRRQLSLDMLLDARDGTARALAIELPRPRHIPFRQASAALLLQEIERLQSEAPFIIIDLPGHDSPLARRVLALADTVVTPVNCSQADLAVIGRISPVDGSYRGPGAFGGTLAAIRAERRGLGLPDVDWVVARNRVRRAEHRLVEAVERDLGEMSRHLGFRVIEGLAERVAYRDLLPFGLSHLDLRLIPGYAAARPDYLREMRNLVQGLRLPDPMARAAVRRPVRPPHRAPVSAQVSDRYRSALHEARPMAVAAE